MYETKYTYPNTTIPIVPGDVLYSPIGRSTYFVGHAVIIGTDYKVKEVLPGKPSWYTIRIEQFWRRHRPGDVITLLRPTEGAFEAAAWITENLQQFKMYNLFNYDFTNFEKSYCYKFIAQVYYFGAGIDIIKNKRRLLLPNDIKRSKKLNRIAMINVS